MVGLSNIQTAGGMDQIVRSLDDITLWVRVLGCWDVFLHLCARQRRSAKQNRHLSISPIRRKTHFALAVRPCVDDPLRNPLLYLTRKAEFAASHYYHNPEL